MHDVRLAVSPLLVALVTSALQRRPGPAHASENCESHPPVLIVVDVGPRGFVLGDDPTTGEPLFRPGSGVTAGTVNDNNVWDNAERGLLAADVDGPVDATQNWWSCGGGPEVDTCDGVAGDVVYEPWRTEPNSDAGVGSGS